MDATGHRTGARRAGESGAPAPLRQSRPGRCTGNPYTVPPISYACVESTGGVDYKRRAATCQAVPIGDSPGIRGLMCPRRCERHPSTVPPGLAVRLSWPKTLIRQPADRDGQPSWAVAKRQRNIAHLKPPASAGGMVTARLEKTPSPKPPPPVNRRGVRTTEPPCHPPHRCKSS